MTLENYTKPRFEQQQKRLKCPGPSYSLNLKSPYLQIKTVVQKSHQALLSQVVSHQWLELRLIASSFHSQRNEIRAFRLESMLMILSNFRIRPTRSQLDCDLLLIHSFDRIQMRVDRLSCIEQWLIAFASKRLWMIPQIWIHHRRISASIHASLRLLHDQSTDTSSLNSLHNHTRDPSWQCSRIASDDSDCQMTLSFLCG